MPDIGMNLIKKCPKCHSERPLTEFLCRNVVEGTLCNWSLVGVPSRPPGSQEEDTAGAGATEPQNGNSHLLCPNGHEIVEGDLLCRTCGAELAVESPDDETVPHPTVINGWSLISEISTRNSVRCRYKAKHGDGRDGLVTIYNAEGAEPDPEVYEELQRLSLDHVPEIYETGRHENQAYEVSEIITEGNLDEFQVIPSDRIQLRNITLEIAKALRDFNSVGLRHRDLRPHSILIRTKNPLDLVIDGFGSAQLSEHDLETVAPLEQTRYMAPEVVAGAVSPASDWWSLGIMLLEKATSGKCFEGINDQAFLINTMAHGIQIPDVLDEDITILLRGLLVRDHQARWKWSEFERWYEGDAPEPPLEQEIREPESGRSIELGETSHQRPSSYALAAAKAENWDEGMSQLLRGEILTWLEDINAPHQMRVRIKGIENKNLTDDAKLTVALKCLNPNMPLVYRGEILSPVWLLKSDNINAGHALLMGDAPLLLSDFEEANWLLHLKARSKAIRERAKHHDIELDEEALKILDLSSNRANLFSQWALKRKLYPDTEHPALAAAMDRRQLTEEDLILLLGASVHQLMSTDEVIERAATIAQNASVDTFSESEARSAINTYTRTELMRRIDERTANFARCGNATVDDWIDEFRIRRQVSLPRAIVTLSVTESLWQVPKSQIYFQQIISFFENKLTFSINRGPLSRMTISRSGTKIDLTELGSSTVSAKSILNKILGKVEAEQRFDPQIFISAPDIERRLHRLHSHALLYKRDTGIDGLYLGFPFVIFSPSSTTIRPRIAPILLWPIKLSVQPGRSGANSIAFDSERDEIRLNPALEGFLSKKTVEDWQARRDALLAGMLDIDAVLAEFARDFESYSEDLSSLPPADTTLPRGTGRIACSAVLFHVTYMGQAIVEDLRALKSRPPEGSALAPLLRYSEESNQIETPSNTSETGRYFIVDSDPTQEEAVLAARKGPGLVIEGPPGTGKSQTIVNLIADAIGRKNSVAVVCQKQAALDVVKKRLIAEGLENRLVQVTDLNKDRRRVLMDIRKQLDDLQSFKPSPRLDVNRNISAQRIEAIEQELAEHHEALHKHDAQAGATYRQLLGELIHLEAGDRAPIDNYQLRRCVNRYTREQLFGIEEEIAPIAIDWLVANFEENPLERLKPFQWDDATVSAFKNDYLEFEKAEISRIGDMLTSKPYFETDQPKSLINWLQNNDKIFLSLRPAVRSLLKHWSQLFYRNGEKTFEGDTSIDRIEKLLQHLEKAKASDHKDNFHQLLCSISEAETRKWEADAALSVKDVGILGRLNPARWIARRRIRKLIRQTNELIDDGHMRDFHAAVQLELHVKQTRDDAQNFAAYLSLGQIKEELRNADLNQLKQRTKDMLNALYIARDLMAKLLECPVPREAIDAAKEQETFAKFIASCEIIERQNNLEINSLSKLVTLSEWMSEPWILDIRSQIENRGDTRTTISIVSERFDNIIPYQKFRARSAGLSDEARAILAVLRSSENKLKGLHVSEVSTEIRRTMHRESRLAWKSRIENEHPALLMAQSEIVAKIERLRTSYQEMRHLNRQTLVSNLDPSCIGNPKQWEDITRLHGARAKRLREFISLGSDLGLMELRPVWLMNPDVASRMLPLKSSMFDLILYDEASQIPVEYALPTLYRGKSVVVSGDEKQLPPTSFFNSKIESDEAEIFDGELPDENLSEEQLEEYEETWNRREIKDCPDLLALARTSVPNTMLQVHYRSEYRELIEFSNSAFYGNSLNVPMRHPDHEIQRIRPIEVEHVGGTYSDQTNSDEAQRIVEILAEYWKSKREKRPSIGVVSFNRKQADLIEDKLSAHANNDQDFRSAYNQELIRLEDGQDMSFFVKNVENVQGDERDIILFSTTFGLNSAGSFRRHFGVLGQKGGERRLNVAITRARQKVIIVTSMPIEEISDVLHGRDQPTKPRDFLQSYLHYSTLISNGELERGRDMLKQLNSRESANHHGKGDLQDGFITAVGQYIRDLGYEPDCVDDDTAFALDYAIPHPNHGQYAIGIECDAPRHKILETARARELWRPSVLNRAIPHIHRVSSQGWYENMNNEKGNLAKAINAVFADAAD